MENRKPFKWTISIIAQIDDYNEWEYNNLLKTIEWQDIINNSRYVILEYRQGSKLKNTASIATVLELSQYEPAFKENKEPAKGRKNGKQPKVASIANENLLKKNMPVEVASLADEKLLKDFFNNWVLKEQSRYHMLITWGHGAGLGYFYYADDGKPKCNTLQKIKFKDAQRSKVKVKDVPRGYNRRACTCTQFAANVMEDASKINHLRSLQADLNFEDYVRDNIDDSDYQEIINRTQLLTPSRLAGILKGCYKKPINVFIANNCFTNMFEAGYALRDAVEVYAASQSIVPFAGIDYGKLFESLDTTPKQDMSELAFNITDSLLPRYTNGGFAKAFNVLRPDLNVRDFSLSVNMLKHYEDFKQIIDEIAKYLIEKLDSKEEGERFAKKIDIARSFCGDFAQGVGFIDFTNFFTELIKSFQDENPGILKRLYKKFFFLKEKTLLSIVNPGSLFRFMPGDFYSQSPQIFSIFFPSKFKRSHVVDELIALYGKFMSESENWKTWQWPNFLSKYLGVHFK